MPPLTSQTQPSTLQQLELILAHPSPPPHLPLRRSLHLSHVPSSLPLAPYLPSLQLPCSLKPPTTLQRSDLTNLITTHPSTQITKVHLQYLKEKPTRAAKPIQEMGLDGESRTLKYWMVAVYTTGHKLQQHKSEDTYFGKESGI